MRLEGLHSSLFLYNDSLLNRCAYFQRAFMLFCGVKFLSKHLLEEIFILFICLFFVIFSYIASRLQFHLPSLLPVPSLHGPSSLYTLWGDHYLFRILSSYCLRKWNLPHTWRFFSYCLVWGTQIPLKTWFGGGQREEISLSPGISD